MGRHHDRMPAACVLAEEILEDLRGFGVETDHRLIDDDDFGAVYERARDDQLLTHSVAVALDQLVAPLLEIEQCQQLPRAVFDGGPALIVQARDEAKKFRSRELLVDERPVRDEAELRLGRAWIGDDIDAADLDMTARRTKDARDHAERRRLSGAVRSQKAEQLAPWHREIDLIDGGETAVPFRERREANHFRMTEPWFPRTSIFS